MQYRGLDGKHRSSARGGAVRSINRTAAGAALTLTTLLTLVTLTGAGCGDDDTITPTGGGSGGSAGRAGAGGGGGRGGAGAGGGGAGGTAGLGGDAGTAGTGGSSGAAGAAGAGGSGEEIPDGGVDGGDSGPQLSAREEIFTAYCAKLDEVVGCEPPENCVQTNIDSLYTNFLESTEGYEDCVDEADAYFACQAQAPVSEFECADGAPQYILGSPTCEDEETAFNNGLGDPTTCAD